jgi:hypothetical protein
VVIPLFENVTLQLLTSNFLFVVSLPRLVTVSTAHVEKLKDVNFAVFVNDVGNVILVSNVLDDNVSTPPKPVKGDKSRFVNFVPVQIKEVNTPLEAGSVSVARFVHDANVIVPDKTVFPDMFILVNAGLLEKFILPANPVNEDVFNPPVGLDVVPANTVLLDKLKVVIV